MRAVHGILHSLQGSAFVTTFMPADGHAPTANLSSPTIEATLQHLFDSAPRVALSPSDRVVIFSDFHLGDGGPRDDFRTNASLVRKVLRSHYLESGHTLVLNGDIEELQRFRLPAIRAAWKEMFDLFEEFRRARGLYKLIGNHDEALPRYGVEPGRPLLDAVRFTWRDDTPGKPYNPKLVFVDGDNHQVHE